MLDVGWDIFVRPRHEDDLLPDGVSHANFIEDVRIVFCAIRKDKLRRANAVPHFRHKGPWREHVVRAPNLQPQFIPELLDVVGVNFFKLCLKRHQDEHIYSLVVGRLLWTSENWGDSHTCGVARKHTRFRETHTAKSYTYMRPDTGLLNFTFRSSSLLRLRLLKLN